MDPFLVVENLILPQRIAGEDPLMCHSEPRRRRGIPRAGAKGIPRCARD